VQALGDLLAQVGALLDAGGGWVAGDQLLAQLDLHRAALGDLQGAGHRLGPLGEGAVHLGAVAQVELVRLEGHLGRRDGALRLDAQQGRMVAVVLAAQVVDVARPHQAAAHLAGDRDDPLVALLLRRQAVLLDLEVDARGAEDTDQVVGVGASLRAAVLEQPLAEARGEAARQRDDALGVALDLGQVDGRLAALQPLQKAGRGELDQVAVAGVALGQQRQVVALGTACGRVVVDQVDLTAEDRLDVVLAAGRVHLDGAVHDAVIGQPQGRLVELGRPLGERLDLARPVEQRVLGVNVEMCAGGGAHRDCMLGAAAAEAQPSRRCLRR
jgi:hypothetical protein